MLDSQIQDVVLQAIAACTFPGAVVGYIKDGVTRVLPFGYLTYEPNAPAVAADTVYDLASVTKSIPTAVVILSLIEQGLLSLDEPVEKFVPEMAHTSNGQIRIKHLLTFTVVFEFSGRLSAYGAQGRDAVLQAIYGAPLEYPPGQRYVYNDAPYILLGLVAEKAAGKSLDTLANDLLFSPLGMHHTTFRPMELSGAIIAPTELGEHGAIIGEPHDEKARAFFNEGHTAGHAGLFSTAGDLLTFCHMLLGGGTYQDQRYISPQTVRQMWTQAVDEDGYGLSLGWRTKHPGFMGAELPPHLFGKEGFTGAMVMLNPDSQSALVLLSNRTYPKRSVSPAAIQQVRRALEHSIFT